MSFLNPYEVIEPEFDIDFDNFSFFTPEDYYLAQLAETQNIENEEPQAQLHSVQPQVPVQIEAPTTAPTPTVAPVITPAPAPVIAPAPVAAQVTAPVTAPVIVPAPAPVTAIVQTRDMAQVPAMPANDDDDDNDEGSADEWENSNPSHRFNPNGPFNFAPQVPHGTSSHPESVKRRRIVGKKAGLDAALFRLKESGRSRKRHRKAAIKKTKAYLEADGAEKARLLAEADETSARELAAKIAACQKAWNDLSPEAQRAHMTRAPETGDGSIAAPPMVEADIVRPAIAVKTGATNASGPKQVVGKPVGRQGPRLVPVEPELRSRGPQLWLPVDVRDIDPGLVALATAQAMPFASAPAGQKRSAWETDLPDKVRLTGRPNASSSPKKRRVEAPTDQSQDAESIYALWSSGRVAAVDTVAPVSPSRAVARADEAPVEAPLLLAKKRDAETVGSQKPGRFCRPHKAPTLAEKRAASAIRYLMGSKAGKMGGAPGTVIPPGPLEQLREQDLNARAERDAAAFMERPAFAKWVEARKKH
ncbi:hypothetical protein TWF481_001353 [Arthrobotrys musiformis]|uniref:BZIP domain-containing protein n=1 Tax=Arthrobotrys musiformis TaxID=47236 RepID=A0AAV9WQB2_9PEZI